jgi:hypothetical protein
MSEFCEWTEDEDGVCPSERMPGGNGAGVLRVQGRRFSDGRDDADLAGRLRTLRQEAGGDSPRRRNRNGHGGGLNMRDFKKRYANAKKELNRG